MAPTRKQHAKPVRLLTAGLVTVIWQLLEPSPGDTNLTFLFPVRGDSEEINFLGKDHTLGFLGRNPVVSESPCICYLLVQLT